MSDKVWVIKESRNRSSGQERAAAAAHTLRIEKNPALAFSLSLFFWGAGQLYNGQRALGLFFILMMTNFYAVLILPVLYWRPIASSLQPYFVSSYDLLAAFGVFYLLGLVLWGCSAIHSYHKATKVQTVLYQGINNRLLPPLCSFLIPGWGQFLNGQPKKGSLLLLFALAGHFVVSAFLLVFFLWPVLDTDMDRLLLEKVLAAAIALSPVVFLMWGFGFYDALRISLDPVKKETLRKRFGYAVNRMRVRGWKNGIAAWAKLNLALSLFLIFSLIVSYYYFPQRDYVTMLKSVRSQLSDQKMVLIPDLIDQFLQRISPEKLQR